MWDLALEVFWRDRQVGGLHGVEGTFQPAVTSAFEVTDFSSPSFMSAGIFGTRHAEQEKFARATCMKTSLVERTPGAGRHANFLLGQASASGEQLADTWRHSPSYPCQSPSGGHLREQGARTKH